MPFSLRFFKNHFLVVGLAVVIQSVGVIAGPTLSDDPSGGRVGSNVKIPRELQAAKIEEKLGSVLELDRFEFFDETGQTLRFSALFQNGKPKLFLPVYYNCPSLCNLLLNGALEALKELKWTVGKEFDVIALSFDPKETHEVAGPKLKNYVQSYGRGSSTEGWHFLTDKDGQAQQLLDQVGFRYYYDAKQGEYAHSSAAIFLTPNGKVSRYLHGVFFKEQDMRLALLEASQGKIGTLVDQVLFFCYRYDPASRSYSFFVMRIVQWLSGLGLGLLIVYLFVFWSRQKGSSHVILEDKTKSATGLKGD